MVKMEMTEVYVQIYVHVVLKIAQHRWVLGIKFSVAWITSCMKLEHFFRVRLHILTVLMTGNCPLRGYYRASSGNFLPTFRDNPSAPSSGINQDGTNKAVPKRR